jgi:hypothetical protein
VKIYHGSRKNGKPYVTVQDDSNAALRPLRHFVKHTPSGFDWGHGGSGPADLAWALLIDFYGPKAIHFAEFIYQKFKRDVIANLDPQEWTLTGEAIAESVNQYKIIFDEEFNKTISISSNYTDNLTITATGNIEALIKLSDEIKALASEASMDLTSTNLGDIYYQVLQYCEMMKQDLLNKIGA